MTISKPVKILIGITTFWYALYLLLTAIGLAMLFGFVLVSLLSGDESVSNLRTIFTRIPSLGIVLPIHFCSLFLEVGLLVFYLIHTIKNTKASDSIRILLGLGHLFLPFVAMPIYYYLYIWRENPPEWAAMKGRKVDQFVENVV
ncbi:MAG TPA: hypothetical protein VMN99_00275 [Anaerolineales bacterium]|nr:hypothetical protein [Anaerolineales bacterium]